MVNYGQKKEFHIRVEHVDYYPEIAGVKVSSIPAIAVFSIIPLWFNQFGLSVVTLFALIVFYYRAGRLEDEGNPVFLNASLLKASKLLPYKARRHLLPSLAHIKLHRDAFRR